MSRDTGTIPGVHRSKEAMRSKYNAYRLMEEPYTVQELAYINILCHIISKPQWWIKIHDETIVAKWRAESKLPPQDFSYLQLEIADIAATYYPDDGAVPKFVSMPTHGVFTSDKLRDSPLLQAIQTEASKLEHEARDRGDFHPGSNNQVLDIVHPSFYCVVNRRTRISEQKNALFGDQVLNWTLLDSQDVSNKFQWLPTPVHVDENGIATFETYINNIHPTKHASIYGCLNELFTSMLPMFEQCLAAAHLNPYHRIRDVNMSTVMPLDKYTVVTQEWEKQEYENEHEIDSDEFWEFYDEFDDSRIPIYPPTMPDSYEPSPPIPPLSLKSKMLQVIVKIASIELTPENPTYPGGSWHVEGMLNECIAATGILYYDCENITTSMLQFRHSYDYEYEFDYPQNEHQGINAVYGIISEETINVQEVGHIQAEPGRCVVFPNYAQHRVAPFSLVDRTMPGHRKIVCFFLVTPDHPILSTEYVPPQQESWSIESLTELFQGGIPDIAIHNLQAMGGKITHNEAKKYMAQVMEERKASAIFAESHHEPISLCEH